MEVYKRIKQLCDKNTVTVKQLTETLDLSYSGIKRWDTNSPTLDSLLKVADYFNVSLDYFVGRTVRQTSISNENGIVANGAVSNSGNNSNNFSPNDKFQLTDIEKALLEVSKDLTVIQKIDVINFAREIKKQ